MLCCRTSLFDTHNMQAPDLLKMQRPQELSGAELLAGAVKYGLKGLLSLGSRV